MTDKRCFNKVGISEHNDLVGIIGSGNRTVCVILEEKVQKEDFIERFNFWMGKTGMKYTEFKPFLEKYWKDNNIKFPLDFKGDI